jgi:hypothetical protein
MVQAKTKSVNYNGKLCSSNTLQTEAYLMIVIYDRKTFIVQATGVVLSKLMIGPNKLECFFMESLSILV